MRNATATADAAGQITDLVDYADFGGAGFESTGWGSLVGNDGQPGDPTLGLDHYYARDYDTATGSWMQPDQWRGLLVRPQSLNRFAYVENDPASFSDHLGFAKKKAGKKSNYDPARDAAIAKAQQNRYVSSLNAKAGALQAVSQAVGTRDSTTKSVKAKASNPTDKSADYTATNHPPCVYSYQTCELGGPAADNGNLFGWSDAEWRNAGSVSAGILVGVGVVTLAILAGGCIVATAGGCTALIVGATVIGSAAGNLTTYTLANDPENRTPLGALMATATGAAGGVLGVFASRAIAFAIGTKSVPLVVASPPRPTVPPVPLGRGSTGRTVPTNLREDLAMREVMSAPGGRHLANIKLNDPRWPGSEGWVKMQQIVNGVNIHYVRNTATGAVDDFKFVSNE
ncbi:RHS repeat-associated core domain-containing protein [Microbacterium sp. 179-I 3D4 NHS]|uniref:RHS repeat-associated core domain-containing protein n=1 Tax=Microbacterium sp. 179-I 3D4 NHS TaxID=3142381 RepID=UPI00399F57A8